MRKRVQREKMPLSLASEISQFCWIVSLRESCDINNSAYKMSHVFPNGTLETHGHEFRFGYLLERCSPSTEPFLPVELVGGINNYFVVDTLEYRR